MPCSTCGHTMSAVGGHSPVVFHCPRCGTARVGNLTYVPRLVERCRELPAMVEFALRTARMLFVQDFLAIWRQAGVAEAVTPPTDRG